MLARTTTTRWVDDTRHWQAATSTSNIHHSTNWHTYPRVIQGLQVVQATIQTEIGRLSAL